jgi:hypothetical protein
LTQRAFANDFENLGGGSIVMGQDCKQDGQPAFPPVGLKPNRLDKSQRKYRNDASFGRDISESSQTEIVSSRFDKNLFNIDAHLANNVGRRCV